MLAFKHSGFSVNAGVCIQEPRIAPARGPPLWDAQHPMTRSISAPTGEPANRRCRCKRAPSWGGPCWSGSRSPPMARQAQHQDQDQVKPRRSPVAVAAHAECGFWGWLRGRYPGSGAWIANPQSQ